MVFNNTKMGGTRFHPLLFIVSLVLSSFVLSHSLSSPVNVPKRPIQVGDVVKLLTERYSDVPPSDWKKLRNYLYQTNRDKLSLHHINKVLTFLDENFSSGTSQEILKQSPRILQRNVETKLQPTLDFLLSLYGKETLMVAVQRNPDLLLTNSIGYAGDALDLVEQLLKEDLLMSKSQIRRLKQTHPSIFQSSATQLLSVISFFRSILSHDQEESSRSNEEGTTKGGATKQIAKLLLVHPRLFQLSVVENLQPRVAYLQSIVGADKISKCLQPSNAAILGLSVDENLKAKVQFLQARHATISKHPAILGLSLTTNLQEKVNYFDAMDSQVTNRILQKTPVVFSLSLQENLIPKIAFLRDALWDQDRLVKELCTFPSLLTLSVDRNLRPTAHFYTHIAKYPAESIHGRHLAASLYNRLLPRYYFATDQQLDPLPLHVLAIVSDTEFCRLVGRSEEEFNAFRNSKERLLRFGMQWKEWIQYGTPID